MNKHRSCKTVLFFFYLNGFLFCSLLQSTLAQSPSTSPPNLTGQTVTGYRGIWFDLGQRSEYGSKYSGGLGTYTAKHHPLAVYAPQVNKTFFVYGGTTQSDQRHLLAMISWYDHQRHCVPQPIIVHDKITVNDPHDNPSLNIDDTGHLWVFVSGRARARPGYIYRSREPWSIDSFEQISESEFTYPQPWWITGHGFLHLFTQYSHGRELYFSTSDIDGTNWTPPRQLAGMGGHYQMSNEQDGRIITAFNMHPGGNVDRRTNLYFLQTSDLGQTWQTADGQTVSLPLTDPQCPALVHDYRTESRLVYLKDIGFDLDGNPVLLYLTSSHYQPGPNGNPRTWTIAHWQQGDWQFHEVTTSTHNYDMGSLYLEPSGIWRIIAPTLPGPQNWGAGGELALWLSYDQGRQWFRARTLTANSPLNHNYARRPRNAHPDFYAFWADGNPDSLSESHLYFTNKTGDTIYQLPYTMTESEVSPTLVKLN